MILSLFVLPLARIILFYFLFLLQYFCLSFVSFVCETCSNTFQRVYVDRVQSTRSWTIKEIIMLHYISSNGPSCIPIFRSLTHSRQHVTKISARSASKDDCSKGSCISKYRREEEREKIISPSLKLTLVTQSLCGRFQGCQRNFFENWYETKIETERQYNTK